MQAENMNEIKYAGFWIRFVASFADTIFLALPVGIVIYFLSDGNWFDFSAYQQNIAYAMSGNAQKSTCLATTDFAAMGTAF